MSAPHPGDDGPEGALEDAFVARVPAWQSAAVLLVAAAAAAVALYTHVNTGARIFAALVALATAAAGIVTARAYLVADPDGVSLRVVNAKFFPWASIASVEVIVRKNQPRIYLLRDPRPAVALPSFLLLPLKPAGLGKTLDVLSAAASEIVHQRPR